MKPGYKQTEVGVIPVEWEVKHLGELGSVVRGGSPRPAGDSRYFNGDFIPWLTVASLTNISDEQLRVTETIGFLTEEGSKHSRTLVNETLIIANSGATLGVVKILGVTCCANDGIAAIINQRSGDKEFICHYINTRTKHLRDVVATGNGQPNLNTALIRDIPIPFPPLPEQRAIAEALSDVDALLASLDKLIVKKRGIKQAAMQQLLTGHTRLPGFKGEWVVIPFRQGYGQPSRHGVYKSAEFQGRGTRIVNMGEMFGFEFISDQEMNRVSLTGKEISTSGLCDGDLLFGRRSVVPSGAGKCSIVVHPPEPLIFESSIIRVRLNLEIANPLFYYYFFASPKGRLIMSSIVSGTNVKGIRGSELRDLEIPHPILIEQTAIAEVLSDMDAELAALEQRRDKTCALKQGMMQELLTGRTRLV